MEIFYCLLSEVEIFKNTRITLFSEKYEVFWVGSSTSMKFLVPVYPLPPQILIDKSVR